MSLNDTHEYMTTKPCGSNEHGDDGYATTTILAVIVFFMQAGFAFLEAGSVRSKNTTSILFKNFMDTICGCVAYWAFGYAFAFGDGNGFIGTRNFFLSEIGLDDSNSLVSFFVLYVYAITAVTIVSGAMAERTQLKSYFVFAFLVTAWVQPVVAHWAWAPQGWLYTGVFNEYHNRTVRYVDYAGSSVVHVVGGMSALIGAAVVGARNGRFDVRGRSVTTFSQATTMSTLGGFIILFGFFAFNLISDEDHIKGKYDSNGLIVVNCILAACGGSLSALTYRRITGWRNQQWSLVAAINGAVAGLVSISAGAKTMYSYAAFIVGLVSGVVYSWVRKKLELKRVDDPLDAVAVHLGGGVWGILCVPFLDADMGLFYQGNRLSMLLLGWNLCGLVVIVTWTFVWAALIFGILSWLNVLRVTSDDESRGLDEVEHGERAYSYQMTAQDSSSSLTLCRALFNMYGDLPPALRLGDTSRSHNEVKKESIRSRNAADVNAEEDGFGSSFAIVNSSNHSESDPVSVV
ncbi:putative ammonium transporter 1 isoform X2 [Corticium candelabrum]|uniref:putative ammonium transporter 1 isoform X2 n=1 Tax=Corticium candelabrum TaxID=121492 RepID=UPI002E25F889|nr:putative ammonium transporter 1 isoform X2 [Corticium candelabrum]